MSNKLILASLLTLSATAQAVPARPPWLLVQHKLETSRATAATWDMMIYPDGDWSRRDVDASGKHVTTHQGHLAAGQVTQLRDALAKAKWAVSTDQFTCAAIGTEFDSYAVDGNSVWESHVCQPSHLDADSARAIQTIDQVLDLATKASTLVAVQHRSEVWGADVPTWDVIVRDDGTWERHAAAIRGHGATTTTGAFTAAQMTTLRDALAVATWTAKPAEAACDALGVSYDAYLVGGESVWEAHMCPSTYLDKPSGRAIDAIDQLVAKI